MSAEDAAKEDKRGKRVKREQVKAEEEEKPVVMLKDPYWVGRDVEGARGYSIRKEILNKGHKYVILYLECYGSITHRISFGCRLINGEFLGWNQSEEYPVTLRQVGQEAVLSLHKSEGTKEIRLTIECPY